MLSKNVAYSSLHFGVMPTEEDDFDLCSSLLIHFLRDTSSGHQFKLVGTYSPRYGPLRPRLGTHSLTCKQGLSSTASFLLSTSYLQYEIKGRSIWLT